MKTFENHAIYKALLIWILVSQFHTIMSVSGFLQQMTVNITSTYNYLGYIPRILLNLKALV